MGRSMTAPQLLHINPFQEQIAKLWFAGIRLEMRVAKLVEKKSEKDSRIYIICLFAQV